MTAEEWAARYEAILATITEGLVVADAEGNLLSMNPAALRIYGLDRLEEGPRNLRELTELLDVRDLSGRPLPVEQWPLARAVRGETFSMVDVHVTRKDTGRTWFASYGGAPVRDHDGRIILGIVTLRDISLRKAAEAQREQALEALRASELFSRQIIDSSLDCIKVLDMDGRILSMNTGGQRMMEVADATPYLGMNWAEFWRPEARPAALAALAQARGGGVGTFQGFLPTAKGRPKWWDVVITPIPGVEGRPERLLAVSRDVTERKQAEEQLKAINETLEKRVAQRTAEVEQRSAQLRKLAAELVQTEQRERHRLARLLHDHLQQLLFGARLRADALRSRVEEGEARQTLQQVVDLLYQSIIASRSLTVELSPPVLYEGDFTAALQWLAEWMRTRHGLRVEVHADPAGRPEAEEVRVMLFHTVRELLFNVVKHAGTDRAWIELQPAEGERVQITVADGGVGFDPARQRSGGDVATGLGLFSIRERLELMGGQLDVWSTPGQGTRVTLTAPLRVGAAAEAREPAAEVQPAPAPEAAPAAEQTPPGAQREGRRIRIVLVDDHEIVREGLARLLQREPDMEVVGEAGDGRQAIERVRELHPDVVVMDMSMPEMNGLDATRAITGEWPSVYVVVLTMHEPTGMAEALREAGACAYLSKDGPSDTLISTIRACAAVGAPPIAPG